ncbi:MAG: acyltransferase [Verrucomicrobiota bacterium]
MIGTKPIVPTAAAPVAPVSPAFASPAAAARLGYRPSLDGLRGVAILCVLAVNSLLPFFPGGFLGVDIFFVLSGFLITTLLMEEWDRSGAINLKYFYARRALRLLPALFLLLTAACLYGLLFQSREMAAVTWRESLWVLFYFANWMLTIEHEVGSLDHAWSLSVEEQFYVLWPIALLMLLRLGVSRDRILMLLGLLIVAAAIWRAFLWHNGAHYLRLYYGSDTRADALLIGCFTGLLFSWNRLPRSEIGLAISRALAAVGVLFLLYIGVLVPHDAGFLYAGGFTLIAFAAAVLLVQALGPQPNAASQFLANPMLVWIGCISYSLYLWHYPIFHALRLERFESLGWNPFLVHTIRFAAVFAAAGASYYFIERPFLRLKPRLHTAAIRT